MYSNHRHKRTHGSREAAAAGGTPGALDCSNRSRVGRKRKTPNETEPGKKMVNNNTNSNSPAANILLNNTTNGTLAPPSGMSSHENGGSCRTFKCPACPETFISELNLDHHMYECHPGQEVVCEQCNFTCPNYNYLKLHKTMFHFSSTGNYFLLMYSCSLCSIEPGLSIVYNKPLLL